MNNKTTNSKILQTSFSRAHTKLIQTLHAYSALLAKELEGELANSQRATLKEIELNSLIIKSLNNNIAFDESIVVQIKQRSDDVAHHYFTHKNNQEIEAFIQRQQVMWNEIEGLSANLSGTSTSFLKRLRQRQKDYADEKINSEERQLWLKIDHISSKPDQESFARAAKKQLKNAEITLNEYKPGHE
ncbi:MAG: hypothetical protein CMH26_09145 [Micavibrio sp.]|nr:hypothetical protein [Micavibrio sp.]|tara:strand:+ start:912 stop:1472 length:561 start_codon:yes stop_codon:yes gene_type:complete